MITLFLFGTDWAMSTPSARPSPIAVSPLLGWIAAIFPITRSLSWLKYAAVVAPDWKVMTPTESFGSRLRTSCSAAVFAASMRVGW